MAGVQIGIRAKALGWAPMALALVTGAALLLMRPLIAPYPRQAPVVLALVYAALLMVSVAPADRGGARRLHPLVVLAAGVAAVAFVRLTAERVAPASGRVVFVMLGLAAAMAEEAYFRRLMYGALSRFGAVVAITGPAAMFALMHYQGYGLAAMPLDFGAGLMLGWQRWAAGTWAIPAATHAVANLLASM